MNDNLTWSNVIAVFTLVVTVTMSTTYALGSKFDRIDDNFNAVNTQIVTSSSDVSTKIDMLIIENRKEYQKDRINSDEKIFKNAMDIVKLKSK